MNDAPRPPASGADPLFEPILALYRAGRFAEALALGSQAGAAAPTLNVAAAAADRQGDAALAERLYRQALARDPRYATTHHNLGLFLRNAGRDEEAEAVLREGLAIDPTMAEMRHCLAGLYWLQERFDRVEEEYKAFLAADPGQLETVFRLSSLYLTQGRLAEGWPLYESRYDPRRPESVPLPDFGCPKWQGESLAGKKLLIWFEQGYGDEIQFCRYVPMLKAMGAATITLFCRPAVAPLLASLEGLDRLVPAAGSHEVEDHDYWTLLMSVPYRVGTTLETIPAKVPYLAAPAERRAAWAERLPKHGLKVGLVWKGNPDLRNDLNRSLRHLSALRPLWDVPGISFVSLQKGAAEDEAADPPPDQPILPLGAQFRDFGDSAAVIDQLDLVISVDTGPAHLAGALAKPVWTLLPYVGLDGRWLLKREDSPWYPTMRLFRQARGEGWAPVVGRVAAALRGVAESRAAPP